MTAVAVLCAIFQLHPAPFCLLDEVDEPLDEANVGRFTAMVSEMSEQVQFLFVTHNKATMEAAQQLTRSEVHTSELHSLMRSSYPVFCLKKNTSYPYDNACEHQHLRTITSTEHHLPYKKL